MSQVIINTAPLVNVRVTSNISGFTAEKRFDRGLTIEDFKGRLELITGASRSSMSLQLYDENDTSICTMDNNTALLGSYPVEENYRIHVVDSCGKMGQFDDMSNVQKFELSEEDYNKRSDSVRSFLVKNKLGKYNEEEQKRLEAQKEQSEKEEEEKANSITVGERCQVKIEGHPTRRGEIMFVGKVHFKPGWWVGVKYDEPLGKNDGSVEGKRYFTAPMKYGGFTRPAYVETGDFPEIGLDDDEM